MTDRNSSNQDNLFHLMYLSRGISRLAALGHTTHIPKNTELNKLGDVPDCCYIVKTGRVICYESTYSGERRVYNFMEPNSIFMEECMLFDRPCPVIFKTIVPSELVRIEKCDMKRAFKHDIDIVMDICESLSMKFLSAMEQIRCGQQRNAEWNICKLLQTFAEQYGVPYDGKLLIKEKLSQQMAGDLLGMNRVTVARKFKDLKDISLLESINGFYCIRSLDQLIEHMDLLENADRPVNIMTKKK